ncbi:GEVED domain-containing protein [Hymenobacter sp. 15J16-1T3B]|uniref:GEVED domain-containing protein n=1 Tax=Hymenobacter sp. 15J16-1T3B TaxID=2886941 RepID=UPI001D0F51FD|nr:GEVED domain-containing protein [Hymenobacter sp. 15J16-1T3B]MCC3159436.1 GEVED domain-containing protein [Hymenobacter sp. 15J16-1T3B]
MTQHLRSWRLAPLFLVLAGWFSALSAAAQCPATTSSCTPGSAPASSYPFAMGIFNVTLGTINSTTAGVADGYRDYSCTVGTSLTIGQNYTLQVRTNASADENVRVWIDLNNDGQFNNTAQTSGGELVFSSSGRGTQSGTVRIGAGATTGVALRMRVAADYVNVAVPTPCSTPQYSQTEDYRVTLQAATAAPVAAFVADQTLTCSGCVQFTDQSTNGPTSWLWDFGDNTTSTQQNPRKCYTTAGTYTVTLTATNTSGSNTSTRTGYVTYNSQVPVAAACTPTTLNYCCNYGITAVNLGTLTNTSTGGSAGYQDFTCTGRVSLTEATRYPLTIITSSNRQDTRVWLDLNNDGQFASSEQLLQSLDQASPVTGFVTIPNTAVKNVPLRLRIVSDFVGSSFTACAGVQQGQAEDYTVTVLANTQPPTADFTSNYATTCTNPVQFTDQSSNATSWAWTFGDGGTSTQQNPTHTYATSGVYDVSLTATNSFGSQTMTKRAYIAVSVPCLTYCASTGTNLNSWITTVQISGGSLATPFVNTSAADPNGYGNYTTRVAELRLGTSYTMSVAAANNFQRTTTVWIDYNRNGSFTDAGEQVLNIAGTTTMTSAFTLPTAAAAAGFTRMRVLMRLNGNAPQPCVQNQVNAETEDYSVNISPALATAAPRDLPGLEVYPNPTPDGQLQLRLAAAGAGLYEATVENLLGAVVLRQPVRLGAAETVLSLAALPQGVYVLRLHSAGGQQATRRIVRN